jgi:preprotein translocase subunit SecE
MAEGKKNFLTSIREYFKSVTTELKKVTWPDRKMVSISTVVILLMVFFVVIYVGVIDFLFTKIMTTIMSLVRG